MSDSSSAVPPTAPGASPAPAGQEPAAQAPALQTLAQYLRDLSFENPSPIESLTQNNANPTVNLNVTVNTQLARESIHELAITIRVQTLAGDKTLFLIELTYCGLFALVNIPEDQVEPILRVHCATLLFPFIRQIVGDATRDGGFAPLYLNMVDFAQLYQQHQALRAGNGEAPASA